MNPKSKKQPTKTLYLIVPFILVASFYIYGNINSLNSSERSIYDEKYRPQFHFSPEEHWMNDPN